MRTEPIDIFVKYPDRGIMGLQVIASTESIKDATDYCASMRFHLLSVRTLEETKEAFKDVFDCPYVFVFIRGAEYETEFLNWMYDHLEQNNGYKEIYIVPTVAANKVFGSVAKEVEFVNPLFASVNQPKDGFDGLMGILDEMYEDEVAASEIPALEVQGNGGVWYKGFPVGMLTEIKEVTYGRDKAEENTLHLNILNDNKHVEGVQISPDDTVSPSGYFRDNSANIFYDMSKIKPGDVGIVKYQVNKNDKKAYHVMRMWQTLTVYTEYGSPIAKATTGKVPDEVEIITTRPPFPLNNAIGILFARIGAGDARWNSNVIAEISYAGESVPITYERHENGSVTLNIDEFSISDDNYFKYGTRQE